MAGPRFLARLLAFAGLIAVTTLCSTTIAPAAETPPSIPGDDTPLAPPTFEWNVFLGNWQVLGPISKLKRDQNSAELDRQLVDDEAELRPGTSVTIDGKKYDWRAWPGRMIDFVQALGIDLKTGQYSLAYAYTEFTSDADQDAILAITNDDCSAVWLNGKQIHRKEAWVSSELDQATAKVKLQKGTNRLLAKVSQGYGNWEFAARLRPADAEKPLLTINAGGSSSGSMARLPLVDIELLDADGNSIGKLRASGGRAGGSGVRYTIFAPLPDPEPAKIRVHFDEPGFLPFDKTFNWSPAKSGNIWMSLAAKDRVRGRVVDEKTGEPVAGAEFFAGESMVAKKSDDDGRFEFTMKDPLADIVEVRAAGYEPLETRAEHGGEWTVKIARGGHTFRGRVLSADGMPIAGARVAGSVNRRQYSLRTDDEGRFEISGLPKSDRDTYPTISHPDFIAKDSFSQSLNENGLTDVEFRLQPGCVINGRVTAKSDGVPLGGVLIISGTDRFVSNVINPQATTDDQGRFKLTGVKLGSVLVHAFSHNFVPTTLTVNTSQQAPATADFQLTTGKPIRGRVLDPNGKPVPGVTLAIDTINGARMLDRRVNTDDNGDFTYENMPDTPVRIDMFKRGWVSKRDFEPAGGSYTEITLYPVVEHQVSIRASDTDKPPQGLTSQIGYQWEGQSEISWQEEDYSDNTEYDPTSGLLKIHVDEPSNAKLSWRLRAAGYKDVVLPNPEPGTPAKSFDVVMEKTATVRGTVFNADTDEPMPDVLVALVSKQDRLRPDYYTNFGSGFEAIERFTGYHTNTAADGSFEISQPAAGSDVDLVLLSKTGGFHYISNAHAALAGSEVRLPMPSPAVVEGRIIVAGQPIANAPVHLSWIAQGDRARSHELPFGFGGQVDTDAEGRFRYTGLGPGTYQVSRVRQFEHPSGRGSSSTFIASEELLVLPGQTVTHDFVQPAGRKISGQIFHPDGKPAGFCQASLSLSGSQNRQVDVAYSQADGRFEFEHVQPGNYSIRTQEYVPTEWGGYSPEGGNANTTVKVADDDVTTSITLTPRPDPRTPTAAPRATATLSFVSGNLNAPETLVGSLPPDFRGKLFGTDKTFQLSDNYGKVVVVAFWASWSSSFDTTMSELQQLYEKYKQSDDLVFVIVSFDRTAEALQAAIKEQELEIPVLYESRESGQNLAKGFGMIGVPSALVIGRDGRLASERAYNSQFTSTVEAAIKAPAPLNQKAGDQPARLTINLSLDGEKSGIPGARFTVKSFDDVGMPVNEEVLRAAGPAPRLTWFHPPLDDGSSMEVKVEAEGVESQQQTVKATGDNAELTFEFTSPRVVRGRVTLAAETNDAAPESTAATASTPVENMKITATSMNGLRRDATTDADGKFEMRVMPGTYFIFPISNEKFAAISVERQQLTVAVDKDPETIELSVCPSVTVTGTVTDEDDQPVAGAEVRAQFTEKPVTTDDQGKFQLPGVPSRGTVQLVATKHPKFAVLSLEDCDGKEPQTLVLGNQPNQQGGRLAKGMKVPKLPLVTLADGEPVDWMPAADRETLVLFAPLWQPGTRDLLTRAKAWADEHQAQLLVVSTDWSLAQARRQAAAYSDVLPSSDAILFAGPGGFKIAKDWALKGMPQAYLISKSKIAATPATGALP